MVLIVTPLSLENEALRTHLGPSDSTRDVQGVNVANFPGELTVAAGGHGKVQFALTTQMLIRELSPRLVICAGACGALDIGPKMLDVIVAENTIEHDFNLRFERRPLPRFQGHAESVLRLKEIPAWPGFALHAGSIASGDEDIIDAVRAGELRKLTEALAVAWEGAGGARAALFCKTPYLEIRVVTDAANEHAPQDFKKNVQLGMKNIAAVVQKLTK